MSNTFQAVGYELFRNQITTSDLSKLRVEAERVISEAGTTCVRHLRERSEVFDTLCGSEVVRNILPPGLRPVRSILFDKSASENWPVAWHQDLTISLKNQVDVHGYSPWSQKDGHPHVQPPVELLQNMATIRIHLDDTPKENGALMVIPRSHSRGKMSSQEVLDFNTEGSVTCECNPGDILMMSPLILHSSARSTLPSRRRVLHFEYARDQDLDKSLDWLERTYKSSPINYERS